MTVVEVKLSDYACELNSWLSLLSQTQKRQVWMVLHPHAWEELKLIAQQNNAQEVA